MKIASGFLLLRQAVILISFATNLALLIGASLERGHGSLGTNPSQQSFSMVVSLSRTCMGITDAPKCFSWDAFQQSFFDLSTTWHDPDEVALYGSAQLDVARQMHELLLMLMYLCSFAACAYLLSFMYSIKRSAFSASRVGSLLGMFVDLLVVALWGLCHPYFSQEFVTATRFRYETQRAFDALVAVLILNLMCGFVDELGLLTVGTHRSCLTHIAERCRRMQKKCRRSPEGNEPMPSALATKRQFDAPPTLSVADKV